MKKFIQILKWLAITIFCLFILFLATFFFSFSHTPEQTALNVESVDWLPEKASDINFYERKGFGWIKIYNCKIKKAEFLKFAEENEWTLTEETDARRLRQPKLNKDDIIVNHSLIYKKVFSNSGGTRVVYDLEKERLYVTQSHR